MWFRTCNKTARGKKSGQIMPVLTKGEFDVVGRYIRDNFDAVMEQDHRIRERNSTRTISPEIQDIRHKGRVKVWALRERFSNQVPRLQMH
jgi:hypothetical protein